MSAKRIKRSEQIRRHGWSSPLAHMNIRIGMRMPRRRSKSAQKTSQLRRRHLSVVNDSSLIPAPRPPKPPRRDKRRPSKPGRR